MIDFEAEKKKRRKQNKAQAARWNAKNAVKVTSTGMIKSTKPKPTKSSSGTITSASTRKSTGRNHGHITTYRGNPHKMNAKTRKIFNEAKDSYAIPQAMQGFYGGIVSAVTGANLPVSKKAKESTAYKVANVGGQMYGYGVGYGGIGKLTGKAAAKAIGTKTGKKIISKAAKKKLFQTAAKKTLTKAGQNATKKAIEHTARKTAQKVGKGLVKGAIADATIGTAMDNNIARSQGYKVGSDEWKKFMATSAALNIGVGGAVEIVPTAIKGLSKGSSKKTVQKIVNGKIKNVKVDKTYKDNIAQSLAKKEASKAADAVKSVTKTELPKSKFRQFAEKTSQPSSDKSVFEVLKRKKTGNVKSSRSGNTRLGIDDLTDYMNAGKKKNVTKVKNKMQNAGNAPILTSEQETKRYISDAITGKVANETKAYGKVGDNFTQDVLHATNGEVNLSGKYLEISADDVKHSFIQHTKAKQKGDVPLSLADYQKIPEYIDNYDDILEVVATKEGPRIMLGKQINGHSIITEIVRDNRDSVIFKNMWAVDTKKYIEKYKKGRLSYRATSKAGEPDASYPFSRSSTDSVSETVQNVKKYKDHSQRSAADVGPELTATNQSEGLFRAVSQDSNNINKFDWVESLKDRDFATYMKEQRGGRPVPEIAAENGISVPEQIERMHREYIKAKSEIHSKIGEFDVEGSGNGIVSPEFKVVEDTLENAENLFERSYRAGVSGQAELERMAKISGKSKVVDSTQAVRSASGTVDYILRHGITDHAGNVVNRTSYASLIKKIPKRQWKEFNTYAQHLHNIDRWKQDVPVFRQTTSEESKKIVNDILKRHPEFEAHGQEVTDWWNQFTKTWLLDTGQMSKEAYAAMLEKYPHYIPTYRVGKSKGAGSGMGGRINPGKAVRSAKGGVSDVIPLEDNFLAEIDRIVKTAKKNDLYLDIIEELKVSPEKLKQFGVVVNDGTKINPSDITEMLDVAERTGLREVSDKVAMLTAYKEGKAVSAYINRNMMDALQLLNDNIGSRHIRFFREIGTKITNPLKAGITGYNPLFAVSNAMRDLPTLYLQSQHSMIRTTTGLFKAADQMMRGGELYQKYLALGGKSAGYYHQGKGFKDAVGMTKNPIKRTWEGMERFLSFIGEGTETVPRLAEFINSANKYGSSREGIQKALNDAAEVTVNFARSGPVTKTLDGWTLYLNAAVQGLDKFARTLKAHPIRTTGRGLALITAPYAALMAVNWENPNYQDLTERTKQNYYCIPNLRGEKDANGYAKTFIKLPINREYGAILASSLDVIAGYVGGEANPFKGYGETLATNFMPPSLTTDNVFAPVQINMPNNKDFAGRNIIPGYLEKASPKYQYDGSTSGAAKGLANIANHLADNSKIANVIIPDALKSPMKLDYLIDSYGGYLGQVAQSASNGYAKDAKSFLNNVVVDPFKQRFGADPRFSSGVMQNFYDAKDKVETAKTDDKINGKESTINTVKSKVYNEISSVISDLTKEERLILSNPFLSKETKDERIKQIRARKNEIARSAVGKIDAAVKEYKAAPNFAVLDKNVKKKWKGSGIDKETFAKLYNSRTIKEGQGKSVANRIKMANAGGTYKEAKALDSRMSKESWTRAKNLANLGITAKEAQKIAKKANSDGNSSISKAEMIAYLARTNYSNYEKAYIFAAFCPTVKYNPYY